MRQQAAEMVSAYALRAPYLCEKLSVASTQSLLPLPDVAYSFNLSVV
jgi:hypothetical protein